MTGRYLPGVLIKVNAERIHSRVMLITEVNDLLKYNAEVDDDRFPPHAWAGEFTHDDIAITLGNVTNGAQSCVLVLTSRGTLGWCCFNDVVSV